ncbi:hypothetical protein HRR83_005131 [Exophiala dermatitidis]|uniref:WLM domain-containing protein n=1 Tax=Exophiala dermatitidis TaxID=5970 RepID=A0AAN6IUY2_EXODE|nr:hypothetical protein HRR75_004303 [Exophiala dermatitidis]KAJ4516955.1 hypothetical protein HRR74_004704 [Exophiala dermatitidis]KAJ4519866.1 hypothetical protein HRR73_003927 [Exophiala dermatitidis]KAJ4534325.1 hypothetical protein HRR76_006253 [Exophiala dermatitidis]KAJ4541453.1 hypothetical protein HRR77_006245 [Exophiala dermatitidis]
MPLNTLRLNHQKSTHPNDRIVFIKPLPRSSSDRTSYDLADTFLRAIAAQCLPIMKNHFLSITTLEEHEPNREFIGRNFNNGEVIQLVLRSQRGGWLPFNMVQMVMMHELAHNTHMNHGRDFWKTRNLYVEELKSLWQRGYTGEGFWGSGRALSDLSLVMSGNNVLASEELARLPLCGGTFRSRRTTRKRKRGAGQGEELTWKEKRDRRIEKKFGKNGVALGEDESKRLALDYNHAKMKTKTTKGVAKGVSLGLTKPRVAQSKRGRELRAAAALARFETNKKEVDVLEQQNTKNDGDEEEDDNEEEGDDLEEDAVDSNGRKLLDSQGQGMVRVCDHEDAGHDVDAKHELEEMNFLDRYFKPVIQRQQQKQEQEQEQQQQQKRPASDQTRSNGDDYVKGKNGLLSNDAAERPTSPDLDDQSRNEQDSSGISRDTSTSTRQQDDATSRLAWIVDFHLKANKNSDRDRES